MVAIPLMPPETSLKGNINKLIEIANSNEPNAIIVYFFNTSKKSPFLLFQRKQKNMHLPTNMENAYFKLFHQFTDFVGKRYGIFNGQSFNEQCLLIQKFCITFQFFLIFMMCGFEHFKDGMIGV